MNSILFPGMDSFNVIAGMASIVSLGFAAWTYGRARLRKSAEDANVALLRERLRSIATTIHSSTTIIQILIRRADDPDVPATELQNIARSARASIMASYLEAIDFDDSLKDWKFGQLLQSKGVVDPVALQNEAPHHSPNPLAEK